MTEPATVTVELPRLVTQLTGVPHRVELRGETTTDVLKALLDAHPEVRPHLLDERGELRVHVLCAVDGEQTRLDRPLPVADGSLVRFVGSVAGG